MAELTPIPAEQRRAYYDALLAGRDEAARQGHHLIDDRIFIAFHRALYRPMLDAHEAEVRAKVSEEIAVEIENMPNYTGSIHPQWSQGFRQGTKDAAAIARQHAGNGPRIAVEAPVAHAESHPMGEGCDGAQEAVG